MGGLLRIVVVVAVCFCIQINGQHEANRCVWYDDCGGLPCENDGMPQQLTDPEGLFLLFDLCPNLATTPAPVTCCSTAVLRNMAAFSIRFAQQNLRRCPGCYENFLNHFCQITCSPNQSQFINVTATMPLGAGLVGVTEVDIFLTNEYASGIHTSCKNVLYPGVNDIKVFDIMCPGYPGEKCNAPVWFNLLYTTSITAYTINYNFVDSSQTFTDGIVPLADTPLLCENPAGGDPACSCQDCPAACDEEYAPEPTDEPFEIGEIDGLIVILVIVFFVIFSVLFILMLCIAFCKTRRSSADEDVGDVTCCDSCGKLFNDALSGLFEKWGKLVATHPFIVLLVSAIVVGACSAGMYNVELVYDPVELWSNPNGQTRKDKAEYEEAFGVASRVEQIFITPRVEDNTPYDSFANGPLEFNALFNLDIFEEILALQNNISQLQVPFTYDNGTETTITLEDVCVQPQAPLSKECLINSVLQHWQNDLNRMKLVDNSTGRPADFRDHFLFCANSPLAPVSFPIGLPCASAIGVPAFAYTTLGGYDTVDEVDYYNTAEAFVYTTFLRSELNNEDLSDMTLAWEEAFIDFMLAYSSSLIRVSFYSEFSLEDELRKDSEADTVTIVISYCAVFVYIVIALGQYSKCSRLLVDSKILLGLSGIVIILLSITTAAGIYGYAGVKSSLITLEVVPFIILAVGADNMFILVKDYQLDVRRSGETREEQIGRTIGRVGPSIFMCGLSESFAFFVGAYIKIEGIRTFALYAGLALLCDFILQISAFVAMLSLDAWRQDAGRMEPCCCCSCSREEASNELGYFQLFMKKFYAPVIVNKWVRPIIVTVFVAATCISVYLMSMLTVVLDRAGVLDDDSYATAFVLDYQAHGKIGPPVYFVVSGDFDYTSEAAQNMICGGANCSSKSLNQQISLAAQDPKNSLIAFPTTSWLDDYFDWIGPNLGSCCKRHSMDTADAIAGDFCPTTDAAYTSCFESCIPITGEWKRPTGQTFTEYLPRFLGDPFGQFCTKGGVPFHNGAVVFNDDGTIKATYFATFHTTLATGLDDIASLELTLKISEDIEAEIRKNVEVGDNFRVYAYSNSYVYYEQFLDLVDEAKIILPAILAPVFIVTLLLMAFDFVSSIIVIVNVAMVVVDTMGVMYLFDIYFNAVSLVNLMMATGISIEFISHIVRTFRLCTLPTRKQRAEFSLATTGSSILSGVTLTNLAGIIVLSFASSKVFRVYYFQMFLAITLIGTLHGLVFLPALLAYIGPSLNRAEAEASKSTSDNVRRLHMTKLQSQKQNNGYDNKVVEP